MTDDGEESSRETPKKGIRIGTLPGVLIILAIAVGTIVSVARFHEQPARVRNEPKAIHILWTIAKAQEQYRQKWERYGELGEMASAGLIRKHLAEATVPEKAVNGYSFRIAVTKDGWSCTASPIYAGKSGARSFYVDETGVIRWALCKKEDDPPAGPDS